ncbi:alpha/beta fold hydrolase [Arsenicicoccus bolidensis]|uniref:alpha/beta fold hydrolase n=1 Tax=Arsenicicoccus bolidensis TaxID=229480 RepID=UPI0004212AA7|nr:alpha/beta hydrolase [Arsenicicoccus bolidensis]
MGPTPTPTLVLLHGTRMNAGFWRDYPALLPGVRVVTPDLPGHGSRGAEDFTWEGALATVEQALPADGPVVLAGHSLGGYVAMSYAAAQPHRLAGLGLVGATGVPAGAGAAVYRGFARLVPVVGSARMAHVANGVMRRLAGGRDISQVTDDGQGYAAMPAAWSAVMAQCGPHLLGGLDIPVLLLNGGLDQMRLGVRAYAAACPAAQVVTVPRATHFLPLTHPEACATHLRGLLDRATQTYRG